MRAIDPATEETTMSDDTTLVLTGLRSGYRIETALGRGGMGEVYKARDTRLDRTVAIKVLRPDVTSPDGLARFEREARAVAEERQGIQKAHVRVAGREPIHHGDRIGDGSAQQQNIVHVDGSRSALLTWPRLLSRLPT